MYNGERLCQGKEKVRQYVESHPEMLSELDEKIRSMKDRINLNEDEFELDDDDEFDIRTMEDDGDLE